MPTPQTGTFRIEIASTSSQVGDWSNNDDPLDPVADIFSFVSTDGSLKAQVQPTYDLFCAPFGSYGITPAVGTHSYDASLSNTITLNKGTINEESMSIGSLPSGFTVTSGSVNAKVSFTATGSVGPNYQLRHEGFTIGTPQTAESASIFTLAASIIGFQGPAYNLSVLTGTIGYQAVVQNNQFGATPCGLDYFDGNFRLDYLWLTGAYALTSYQWYLQEVEEEYQGIKYKRNKLVQVDEGDDPPDGYLPIGAVDETPTYLWWEYNVDDIILYLYQPVSPGTLWTIVEAPTNYGWWKSFEEFLGGALLIVNGNPKKPRTFEQITDFSDFMGGFPGAGATLNHRLIYAAKDT